MHTIYLKQGTILLSKEFELKDLDAEVTVPNSPTVDDDFINIYTNDEAIVKKAIEIIGKENIKEVAPELTR